MTRAEEFARHRSAGSWMSRLGNGGLLRGYLLILLPLLFVCISLLYPLGLLVSNSFWRQDGAEVVKDLTLENYATFLGSANLMLMLGKTLLMSALRRWWSWLSRTPSPPTSPLASTGAAATSGCLR